MKCKNCGTEIMPGDAVCPECGSAEFVKEKKSGKSVVTLVMSIVAAIAALGCLAVLLLIALGFDFKSILPRENDILKKDVYAVSAEEAAEEADEVVATIGDKELTNQQLQIYYRMQAMDLLNYYGDYISDVGLDLTKPFSEQTCKFDETLTWEQYLIKVSIETWQNYQTIALLGEEAKFILDEEYEEALESLPAELLDQAKESGFETVDELLKDAVGPTCDQNAYVEYVRLAYFSTTYYETLNEKNIPTAEELDAYYEKEKATFEEQGITKDMGNISNVRHILLMPKNGVANEETGMMEYSEKEWEACFKEAEKILNEWKNGAATEESFAELANTYSEDGGSNTTGCLYEGVAPGSNFVENFLNWSIDMNRQVGDTEIVKTEYGYHIMYYVSGESYWEHVVQTQLIADRITTMTTEAEEKWPMEVTYKKIAVTELKFD